MAIIPIKILILGNSGVGKTSLCNRYVNDSYIDSYKPTIGVELCSKNMLSPFGKKNEFRFQFWDICGQESYLSMSNMYYKNTNFCLIMFDLTDLESFKACAKWKRDLDEKFRMENGKKCPCLLIGNKNDMPNRVLDQFDIEDFCRDYEIDSYIEISVKRDIMVKETIDYVAKTLIKKTEYDLAKEKSSTSDFSSSTQSTTSNSFTPMLTKRSTSISRNSNDSLLLNNSDDYEKSENLACYPLMLFFLFVAALFVIKRILLTIVRKSRKSID